MKSESIKYIVLHCSATPCNKKYDKEQMLRDHKNRGFYTWVITTMYEETVHWKISVRPQKQGHMYAAIIRAA